MHNIRLPVATRYVVAHSAGGEHQNIKGACVAILSAVPRGQLYQMFKLFNIQLSIHTACSLASSKQLNMPVVSFQ